MPDRGDDLRPVHSEEEILMRVYRRGGTLRWRRRAGKVASMTMSLALVGSAMAYALNASPHGARPPSKDRAASAGTPQSEKPEPRASHDARPHPTQSTTPPESHHAGEPSHSTEPTVTNEPSPSPSPSTEPDASETPAPDCRDSYDPACGDFHWDPSPGENAAMTGRISFSPANPRPGEEVTFTLVADDPDAGISTANVYLRYGDASSAPVGGPGNCSGRYGAWTPPAKQHGHVESSTIRHTYRASGDYRVSFLVVSAGNACYQPYLNRLELNETIHVRDSSPSPSPSQS